MDVYLLDGTYELFRHFFALPSHVTRQGREVAASRGVITSVLGMLESGCSHLGVATDHVIESFRNGMWAGYKTSAGVDPRILDQFPLLEEGLQALGVALFAMTELEADDAMGALALFTARDRDVSRVFICSPDKDLAQCVVDSRVLLLDRRANKTTDEDGVLLKFGVLPASIPDFLALMGDSADGFPGLPGWGRTSAASLLRRYGHIEAIPDDAGAWDVAVRGASRLAATLAQQRDLALLFRDIATLRCDEPMIESVEELRWTGPRPEFEAWCQQVEMPALLQRARLIASQR